MPIEQQAILEFLLELCYGARQNQKQVKRIGEINSLKWWQFARRTLYIREHTYKHILILFSI